MTTKEYIKKEIIKYNWSQSDDGWFNTWDCSGGNVRAFRSEKDGLPMREATAIKLATTYCSKCDNKERCYFYDLYR